MAPASKDLERRAESRVHIHLPNLSLPSQESAPLKLLLHQALTADTHGLSSALTSERLAQAAEGQWCPTQGWPTSQDRIYTEALR